MKERKKKLNINGGEKAHSHYISTGSWKSWRLSVYSLAYFTRGHFQPEILLGVECINGTAGGPADAQLCHSQ